MTGLLLCMSCIRRIHKQGADRCSDVPSDATYIFALNLRNFLKLRQGWTTLWLASYTLELSKRVLQTLLLLITSLYDKVIHVTPEPPGSMALMELRSRVKSESD